MFIVRFQGGLGNQMFQYAFLCALQEKYPGTEVLADLTSYNLHDYHYGFELKKIFGISVKEAKREDIERLSHYQPWIYGRFLWRLKQRFFGNYPNNNSRKTTEIIETKTDSAEKFFSLPPNIDFYMEGFWQKEEYFSAIREKIHKDFCFHKELYIEKSDLLSKMKLHNSVSIHVRRGDYVGSPFDCLSETYYEDAIRYLQNNVTDPYFYFFSDDPIYVRTRFEWLKNKMIISDNTGVDSYKDMFLMSQCSYHIIANSSFSYWGAELAHYKSIVVAPKWFSKTYRYPLANDGWIIL